MLTGDLISKYLVPATAITAGTDDCAAVVLTITTPLRSDARFLRASLLITARGLYEASVNGVPVTDSVLNPGWTSYEWRLRVQEFDVTDLFFLSADSVSLEVTLGNGWYRGKFGFERQQSDYGSETALLAALVISYDDGNEQVVRTSPLWRARRSQVTYNNLYNGETIDARLRGGGPTLAVREVSFDYSALVPHVGPLTRRVAFSKPHRVWTSPAGKTLVDFGQNLVGWVKARVSGPRGHTVVLRHAEVIESGELGVRPLRWAEATDRFILSGGDDVFEPTMTFHGFRFVEVSGWPGELDPNAIEAVVVSSDISRIGRFSCSNDLVNRLVHNSVWSQRGNFLDVPTDCPQRDEREGWTGDIAVYAPTACFQFDCGDFLHKWLLDLREETLHNPSGFVPMVVPDIVKLNPPSNILEWIKNPTAIWGDAAVWVPEALWRAYGNVDMLREHYATMAIHLESVERELDEDGLWCSGFQFGDWLDPSAPPNDPADAKADRYVVAQASLYRSATFVAEAAKVLGLAGDAERWGTLSGRVRKAFLDYYVKRGRVASDCVTVYALAIHFGLLDDDCRMIAGNRLAELVREDGYHVSTGFAGTPYVTWALSETGHVEDAYRMLLQTDNPSWLYPVTMGATTTWERWDSMLPDGQINPGQMTSFNHYALGAVCDWIYQRVGGISPSAPGYSKVLVSPVPGGGLTWADCSLETPHGRVAVSWELVDTAFSLRVEVPESVTACVVLPNGESHAVDSGIFLFGCTVH